VTSPTAASAIVWSSRTLARACSAGALPWLYFLHLPRQHIGDAGVAALADAAAAGAFQHLASMSLGNNAFGDAGLRALTAAVAAGHLPSLREVDLGFPRGGHPEHVLRFSDEVCALAQDVFDARGVRLHFPLLPLHWSWRGRPSEDDLPPFDWPLFDWP
jgi:hypothetical protein